ESRALRPSACVWPDAGRRLELHALGRVRRILGRIREVGLLGRHQVAQIRLHGGDVRLRLRVGELRDRDRGKNTDDHDDDQKLDEGETATGRANFWSWLTCGRL